MRALILVLALAACSQQAPAPTETPSAETPAIVPTAVDNIARMPAWGEARANGVDFRGVGQEPGWMIDVYQQNRILLLLDYGESLTEFPLPTPSYPAEGVTRYETQANGQRLSVNISRNPCHDSMSGEAFPATVTMTLDRRTFSGCGRSV